MSILEKVITNDGLIMTDDTLYPSNRCWIKE